MPKGDCARFFRYFKCRITAPVIDDNDMPISGIPDFLEDIRQDSSLIPGWQDDEN